MWCRTGASLWFCEVTYFSFLYLQLMKLAAGLRSRASTCSGSSVFSPARSVHSLVCSHSNTFHCWEAHISNTKSAVGTKIRMVQQHDVYHTTSGLTSVCLWCYYINNQSLQFSYILYLITFKNILMIIRKCDLTHLILVLLFENSLKIFNIR